MRGSAQRGLVEVIDTPVMCRSQSTWTPCRRVDSVDGGGDDGGNDGDSGGVDGVNGNDDGGGGVDMSTAVVARSASGRRGGGGGVYCTIQWPCSFAAVGGGRVGATGR